MILQRDNIWAQPISATPEELALLTSFLAYDRQGAKRTYEASLQNVDRSFRAGFIPLLKLKAREKGFTVEELDQRVRVEPRPDWKEWLAASWLRQDQKDAVSAMIRNVYGIFKAPTGAGKGECFVALMGCVPDAKVLMVVPNKDLLDDTVDRVAKRLGEPCGKIGDGHWSTARITVATYQTLYSRYSTPECQALLGLTTMLLVDETHHAGSPTAFQVYQATPNAYYRIAGSATPLQRGDDGNFFVLGSFGPIRYELSPEEVLEAGVVARPIVKLYPCHQFSTRGWPTCYQELVVRSQLRNDMILELAKRAPKPCMIAISDIPHGMALTRWLKETGLRSEFIYGETPTDIRKAAVGRMASGVTEVLVASVILNQGQLSPLISEIRSIINAAGGMSEIRTIQRVGRGMRKALGKKELLFMDLMDSGHHILSTHALMRMSAYIAVGYEVVQEQVLVTSGRQLSF